LAKKELAEIGLDDGSTDLSPIKHEEKGDFSRAMLSTFKDGMKRWKKPTTEWGLEKRVNDYFDFCIERNIRPTVGSLCVALKTNAQQVYKWKNGIDCTPRWSEIIQEALQIVFASTETLLIHSKINPVTGIFLMKNQQNYKDDISLDEVATARMSRASAVKTIDQMHQEMVVATYEVVDGKTVEVEGS